MRQTFAKVGLLSIVAVVVVACEGNRFEGQTEKEMFETTRNALCETVQRCPKLWDEKTTHVDEAQCVEGFDDAKAYLKPIDEPTREKLDACLDAIEVSDCPTLEKTQLALKECAGVGQYLDLK